MRTARRLLAAFAALSLTSGIAAFGAPAQAAASDTILQFTTTDPNQSVSFQTGGWMSGAVGDVRTFNWGDGVTDTSTSHTYASPGTYTVTISTTGTALNWYTCPAPSCTTYLSGVLQFGSKVTLSSGAMKSTTGISSLAANDVPKLGTNLSGMFQNSTIKSIDATGWDLSAVTNLSTMFAGTHSLANIAGIESWNTGKVGNMASVFSDARKFNQDISGWNTAAATSMQGMFSNANVFNQPIGNWNTGNVSSMELMFSTAYAFNQPIGNWNTSKVTNMAYMLQGATAFNQQIGTWDTSNVTNMSRMLKNAAAFNQSLGGLEIGKVTTVLEMVSGAASISAANWTDTLNSWAAGTIPTLTVANGALGGDSLTYYASAASSAAAIDAKGFTQYGQEVPTPASLPAAPVVTLQVSDAGAADISWAGVSGATSYKVTASGGTYSNTSTVTSLSEAMTFPTDQGTISVVVEACNASGCTAANAKTWTPPAAAPAAPVVTLQVDATGAADISWAAVSGATSYKVTASGGTYSNTSTVTSLSEAMTFPTDQGTISVVVEACNASGCTAANAKTWTPASGTSSGPVVTLQVSDAGAADISWAAVSGATSYKVTASGGTYSNTSTVTSLSETMTFPTDQGTISVVVEACDANGCTAGASKSWTPGSAAPSDSSEPAPVRVYGSITMSVVARDGKCPSSAWAMSWEAWANGQACSLTSTETDAGWPTGSYSDIARQIADWEASLKTVDVPAPGPVQNDPAPSDRSEQVVHSRVVWTYRGGQWRLVEGTPNAIPLRATFTVVNPRGVKVTQPMLTSARVLASQRETVIAGKPLSKLWRKNVRLIAAW